jgi:predicted nucleic acid-binding protein
VRKVFLDTGAWYALKNKNDPDHANVVRFFKQLPTAGIICYRSCLYFVKVLKVID